MAHGQVRAFVGMGGNLGGEEVVSARLAAAAAQIADLDRVAAVRRASRYRTSPVGPVRDQPAFVNSAALVLLRGWRPVDFLLQLNAIEARLGRAREHEQRMGPRAIDLDLLLWDDLVLDDPILQLPHPRLHERAFALAPLVELGGEDLLVPGRGPAGALLAAALADPAQRVERLGP